ncbi:hypothetical protein GCM10027610_048190 [Dactylosporangium cerinum]
MRFRVASGRVSPVEFDRAIRPFIAAGNTMVGCLIRACMIAAPPWCVFVGQRHDPAGHRNVTGRGIMDGMEWVHVVGYENVPGCPRPMAALRS